MSTIINSIIRDLIEFQIEENNPNVLSDDLPDLYNDADNRETAILTLIHILKGKL
jgi:hypothetical protein